MRKIMFISEIMKSLNYEIMKSLNNEINEIFKL
jgi:hypothetical protein